jgi:glycerate kinase
VGELIIEALKKKAEKIIIGIGGSATNDAGTGALRALGWQFLDTNGRPCPEGGAGLVSLERIVPGEAPVGVEISVLCDVQNPLIGQQGASHIYGPQKGASPADVVTLDRALARLATVAREQLKVDLNLPGYGAAGGFAAGAVLGLGATITPGFTAIAQLTNLESKIRECDFVITGEGRLDAQTLSGKAVAGVLSLASEYNKPVVLIVGSTELHEAPGNCLVVSLVSEAVSLDQALADPRNVFVRAVESNLGRIDSFVAQWACN